MMSSHEERVGALAARLAARPRGTKITIRKSTPSHSIRDSGYKAGCHPVDVSALDQILSIDPDTRVARVEGQLFISDLAQAALAQGLLPYWRLYRSFGPRWFLNPVVYLLMPVVLLSKRVFRRPSFSR